MPSLVEIGLLVLEKIFEFRQCIFALRNYLPLKKGGALYLNKLESLSSKIALCKVCLKLAQWFWRNIFFNLVNVFTLFCNYIHLYPQKGEPLHLKKLKIPSTQGCIVPSLVEIGLVVLERNIF